MGIHLRVHSESYQMNANMIRFRWFSKLRPCDLDESSLNIRRVNPYQMKLGRPNNP